MTIWFYIRKKYIRRQVGNNDINDSVRNLGCTVEGRSRNRTGRGLGVFDGNVRDDRTNWKTNRWRMTDENTIVFKIQESLYTSWIAFIFVMSVGRSALGCTRTWKVFEQKHLNLDRPSPLKQLLHCSTSKVRKQQQIHSPFLSVF